MTTKTPLFKKPDPSTLSVWHYKKHHSHFYTLYAVDEAATTVWGRFPSITAMRTFAREHNSNPFNYPF